MPNENEYRKLDHQPLTLVIAEFRFSQVLKMQEFIPDIQECLRKEYPVYSGMPGTAIEISNEGVRFGGGGEKWSFSSADKSQGIEIDQNRLVFFTTKYERFHGFQEQSLSALKILQDIVEPGLLLKVGLRYNDSVVPLDGEHLEEYIEPSWIPAEPLKKLCNGLVHHREETVVGTDIGTLAVRVHIGKMKPRVMPDLGRLELVVIEDNTSTDILTAILDFDHSWVAGKEPVEFKVERVEEILHGLHKVAREAFWITTTKFARDERWG